MKSTAVTGLMGLLLGFFFCWWFLVRPLEARLDAREKAIQEWERINRMEREAIGHIKTINIEELRKWVATLDEQNTRYAELQTLLHRQEIALTGPATTHLLIALITVMGTVGFVAWMMKDSNADAARTLSNAVAVLPSLREALEDKGSPLPHIEIERPVVADGVLTPVLDAPHSGGFVLKYFKQKGFGFIRPSDGGEDIFFHRDQLLESSEGVMRIGARVSFRTGFDNRRRPCAKNIAIISTQHS